MYLIASIKNEYIIFYRIGGELSHVELVFKNGHVHKFTGDHDLQRFREALSQSVQPEPDDYWPIDDNVNQPDTWFYSTNPNLHTYLLSYLVDYVLVTLMRTYSNQILLTSWNNKLLFYFKIKLFNSFR